MLRFILPLFFLLHTLMAETVTIYINSTIDEETTKKRWKATIELLNKEIPFYDFEILPIAPDKLDKIHTLVKDETIDFIITQPAIYTSLEYHFGVTRMLTMYNQYYMSEFGSVFITKDSTINTLEKIKNKKIAAVAPLGFGGWLTGYKELYDVGIDPLKDKLVTFTGSQKKVLDEILNGNATVGVIRTSMYEKFLKEKLFKENELYTINELNLGYPIKISTRLYPEWAFAYAPHVDKTLVNDVFKVMNSIDPTMQAAIEGLYKSWNVPEDYRNVDEIFKTFRLAYYQDIPQYSQEDIIKLSIGILIFFILIFLLLKYRLSEKMKVNLQNQVKIQTQKIQEQDKMMLAQSRHAAMGEMISLIAHQWRQPISVIAMEANNVKVDLELESLKEDDLEHHISNILFQTQELSQTIDDFRNFFKNDKTIDNIYIADIIKDILRIIGNGLENNNITFHIKMDGKYQIETHRRELMQVLINIITNAKEALLERDIDDKMILVNISQDEENSYISIHDNAGGIKGDLINRIFEPYFSTKLEKNGTGLGLYMSKTIINKHLLGELTASNTKIGCCMKIILPRNLLALKETHE